MGTDGDKQEHQGDNISFHAYACFHNFLGLKYNARPFCYRGIQIDSFIFPALLVFTLLAEYQEHKPIEELIMQPALPVCGRGLPSGTKTRENVPARVLEPPAGNK